MNKKVSKGDFILINNMIGEKNQKRKYGFVNEIDSIGTAHGTWSGVGMIPEIDDYKVLLKANEKKGMRSDELFEAIRTCIDDNEFGLDYISNMDFYPKVILDNHYFDLLFKLDYGSSEGIYLDIYLRPFNKEKWEYDEKNLCIGCAKTLVTSDEAFDKMALLESKIIKILNLIKRYCPQINKE